MRWAESYLKKRFGPDGAPLPSSIRQAVYYTQDQLLEPPFPRDEFYQENEKNFSTGGPSLWITKLLLEKAPHRLATVLKAYHKNLRVEPISGTRMISIQFMDPDPDVSAKFSAVVSSHCSNRIRGPAMCVN